MRRVCPAGDKMKWRKWAPKDKPTGQAGETVKRRRGERERRRRSPIPRPAPLEAKGFPSGFPDSPIHFQTGFTIIEMILVMVLIASMIGILFALFPTFRGTRSVKMASREVASLMRLARQKAIIDREFYRVAVDVAKTGGEDSTRDEVWLEKYERASDTWFEVSGPRVHRIMNEYVDIRDVNNITVTDEDEPVYIQFFPRGSADNNYSVHITTRPAPSIAERKKYYTVNVVKQTGRVRIYDYGINPPFPSEEL